MREIRTFFKYVIPSIFSFSLSGVYAIVDGFFVGNSIGDIGISAINVAYPISAVLQASGTGIGMGGAVYYAISKTEKKETQARKFTAGAMWLLLITSVMLTIITFFLATPLLRHDVYGRRIYHKYYSRLAFCLDISSGYRRWQPADFQ